MHSGQQIIRLEEDELAVTGSAVTTPEEDVFTQLPLWLSEEEAVITGTQRGTVLHKVMQYVTVSPAMDCCPNYREYFIAKHYSNFSWCKKRPYCSKRVYHRGINYASHWFCQCVIRGYRCGNVS